MKELGREREGGGKRERESERARERERKKEREREKECVQFQSPLNFTHCVTELVEISICCFKIF